MPDAVVQINEGTGKNLAHWERTVNALTVEEQKMVISEAFIPTYTVCVTTAVAATTANSHLLQIMAGASNRVLIRRIKVHQMTLASSNQACVFQLVRLTTAGTGGTTYTPRLTDPADGAAGATAMTLPTVKGTEGNVIYQDVVYFFQTMPISPVDSMYDINFGANARSKHLVIAAGASNGIALKNVQGITTNPAVHIFVEFCEAPWA